MESASCEQTHTQQSTEAMGILALFKPSLMFTCCQFGCAGGSVLCRRVLLAFCTLLSQLLDQFE